LAGIFIAVVLVVWETHAPSWIGETYFHTDELQTACIQIHNFTDLAETDLCKELSEELSQVVNDHRRPIRPECSSNDVIVGTGIFTRVNTAGGYWTDYECSRASNVP
jgi:hypothetical protein